MKMKMKINFKNEYQLLDLLSNFKNLTRTPFSSSVCK